MHTKPHRTLAAVAGIAAAALTLSACSDDADTNSSEQDATATVMATTTQLGSITEQITDCAGGRTTTLMSAGDDPHQYEASSADIVEMISADLVVANGLGLEASMQRSLENAAAEGAEILELAPQLDPIPLEEADDHDEHEHDEHDHGDYDAHIWLDVSRMADGAELIGDNIADATGDETYNSCGAEVADDLRATDAQIEESLAEVDSARLVTDHAAYGYLADRYGIEISGVVIPGGSTDGEPSSQDLTELTALLDEEGADALVTSKTNTNRMITALADETSSDIPVVELYESALGEPGSGAETYQDAMLYNAEALVQALN